MFGQQAWKTKENQDPRLSLLYLAFTNFLYSQTLHNRSDNHTNFTVYSVRASFSISSSNMLIDHFGEYVIGMLNRTWLFFPI